MAGRADVVIVGGGIAGGALGVVLARRGFGVIVLEGQSVYRDKVRGEAMMPWGAAEVIRLGLEQDLLDAGGGYASRAVRYDEMWSPHEAEQAAISLKDIVPGVSGVLNVGHPEASEVLSRAAAASGATVVRGITNVRLLPGARTEVHYELDGDEEVITCRLVVGADGRRSPIRSQVGIKLSETTPRTRGGGLLVDQIEGYPTDHMFSGTEGDLHYLVFARPGGRARLYLLWDVNGQAGRFRGSHGAAGFLRCFNRMECFPLGGMLAAARPAGPCVSYAMNDSWCTSPVAEDVVLIGDAAGWSDPIIGQGLSVSMRDARMVADILEAGSDWSPLAFAPYEQERMERMRRLRTVASVMTDLRCDFTPEGTRRRRSWTERAQQDRSLLDLVLASLRGPETAPAEAFEAGHVARILAA